jgi:hypothetical protein
MSDAAGLRRADLDTACCWGRLQLDLVCSLVISACNRVRGQVPAPDGRGKRSAFFLHLVNDATWSSSHPAGTTYDPILQRKFAGRSSTASSPVAPPPTCVSCVTLSATTPPNVRRPVGNIPDGMYKETTCTPSVSGTAPCGWPIVHRLTEIRMCARAHARSAEKP